MEFSMPRFFFACLPNYLAITVQNSEKNVISLTDAAHSPIAHHADQLLTAHTDMASFVDSLVAPLSIINALIVALSIRKQNELAERLHRLEQIWDEFDEYAKTK
jgi:DNA-binding MurR/RpiR family transcriptional regulator